MLTLSAVLVVIASIALSIVGGFLSPSAVAAMPWKDFVGFPAAGVAVVTFFRFFNGSRKGGGGRS